MHRYALWSRPDMVKRIREKEMDPTKERCNVTEKISETKTTQNKGRNQGIVSENERQKGRRNVKKILERQNYKN